MRITSKGQVTIPKEVRDRLGLLPGTDVTFEVKGDHAALRATGENERGTRLVEHLRANPGDVTMSTDEIMALTRGED